MGGIKCKKKLDHTASPGGEMIAIDTAPHRDSGLLLLPENWICFLVSIEPKAIIKPKSRRSFLPLLLGASKENTEDLSQSRVSPAAKLGKL